MTQAALEGADMTQAALEEEFLVFKASSSPEEHKGPIWDPNLVQQQHHEGSGTLCSALLSHHKLLISSNHQQGADGRLNTLSP